LRLCTVMRARHLRVQASHSTPRNLDLSMGRGGACGRPASAAPLAPSPLLLSRSDAHCREDILLNYCSAGVSLRCRCHDASRPAASIGRCRQRGALKSSSLQRQANWYSSVKAMTVAESKRANGVQAGGTGRKNRPARCGRLPQKMGRRCPRTHERQDNNYPTLSAHFRGGWRWAGRRAGATKRGAQKHRPRTDRSVQSSSLLHHACLDGRARGAARRTAQVPPRWQSATSGTTQGCCRNGGAGSKETGAVRRCIAPGRPVRRQGPT
jgi:hypothetical protein